MAPRVGVYPGSFNPPTIAHLAIAQSALRHAELSRVDLVVSRVALGKEHVELPLLDDRVTVLHDVAQSHPWLSVQVTDARLLVDIAHGYDVLIMGADKWAQVLDPTWYGSEAARDAALAELPRVVVARRPGFGIAGAEELPLDHDHGHVSSSAARDGQSDLMLPEAAAFDAATGAWTDSMRYRAFRGLNA
jgi:nicotinic acid mononucleotide adenylyltransferase